MPAHRPDWVGRLAAACPALRVGDVVLPGSHNSAAGRELREACHRHPLALLLRNHRAVGERHSRCQRLTLAQQLAHGIRYLDLRVTVDRAGAFRAVHGYLGAPLAELLAPVCRFLAAHPGELVLLHVEPFKLRPAEVTRLRAALLARLGRRRLSHAGPPLAQRRLAAVAGRVALVSAHPGLLAGRDAAFAPASALWANTTSLPRLRRHLRRKLLRADGAATTVAFVTFTPSLPHHLRKHRSLAATAPRLGEAMPGMLAAAVTERLPLPTAVAADFVEATPLVALVVAHNRRVAAAHNFVRRRCKGR